MGNTNKCYYSRKKFYEATLRKVVEQLDTQTEKAARLVTSSMIFYERKIINEIEGIFQTREMVRQSVALHQMTLVPGNEPVDITIREWSMQNTTKYWQARAERKRKRK